MWFECKCNCGLSDQLTLGAMYRGEIEGSSIRLLNDTGSVKWYELGKFKLAYVC